MMNEKDGFNNNVYIYITFSKNFTARREKADTTITSGLGMESIYEIHLRGQLKQLLVYAFILPGRPH